VLCVNQDATAQTHLTGDRLILLDDVKWKWGEIPETTPHTHRRMSSKLSQTPITITSAVTDHLPDAGVATASQQYGSELALQPVVHTSEQVASNPLELVDSESEKGLAESKPLVESDGIQTSTAQPVCNSDTADSQVTEPLPEMKKGWCASFIF